MTNGRIDACFGALKQSKRTALVAYLVIGEPNVEESLDCARAALDAGADILELGVPFSDPTADGHVIAAAAYRAIHNGGSLPAALEVATALRKHSQAPLVLFSYVNPLLAFGETRVAAAAKNAGLDGMLLVDLPPEEGAELRAGAAREGLSVIPLVAPTTGRAREPRVLAGASGFVYYVSVTGVTGSSQAPLADAAREASQLRARAGLPVVVGFGIRTPEQAREVASAGVDGVVVGTSIVQAIAEAKDRASRPKAVAELVGKLRRGLDAR
ncbi:MAG TPA: tryptophan synthase subunit alpha [Polyangiaceae bacterium]|nr:tryptophan synthase subunit alpha [Polyangiaceae bacterium]